LQQYQSTLAKPIHLSGIGIHSGQPSRLDIRPAPSDYGIVFIRHLADGKIVRLPACADKIWLSDLCTLLKDDQAQLGTIEHLMAAIHACGIDNLEIETDHHEVPILDGSAAPFIEAFERAGIIHQSKRRRFIRITKPLRLDATPAWAEFLPSDEIRPICHFDISIDFASTAIGRQHIAFDLEKDFFTRAIAPARTFGFQGEAEILRARGLAQGASLENCLVVGKDDQLLNSQTLRFKDEFVRHKALDSVGDTALLGLPFIGIFRAHRPSHRLNGAIVKALLTSPSHFEIIP